MLFLHISHSLISTRYERHRGIGDPPIIKDSNEAQVFETSSYFGDRDSKKLTIITESKESSDELDNEKSTENKQSSTPKVTFNGVKASDETVVNGEKLEITSKLETYAGNNNEISEVASTATGPTFYGVAVVEPCSVGQVQVEEEVPMETPEVKVTCVREESLDKEDDALLDANSEEKKDDDNKEMSCLDESLENGDEQVINMWMICQFLK